MPGPASIGIADRLAVLDDVGEHQDLAVARQRELRARADLEVAEPAREGDVLLGGELLVAEHQDRVPVVGVLDLLERAVGESGDIDAFDFRADMLAQRLDLHSVLPGGVRGRPNLSG